MPGVRRGGGRDRSRRRRGSRRTQTPGRRDAPRRPDLWRDQIDRRQYGQRHGRIHRTKSGRAVRSDPPQPRVGEHRSAHDRLRREPRDRYGARRSDRGPQPDARLPGRGPVGAESGDHAALLHRVHQAEHRAPRSRCRGDGPHQTAAAARTAAAASVGHLSGAESTDSILGNAVFGSADVDALAAADRARQRQGDRHSAARRPQFIWRRRRERPRHRRRSADGPGGHGRALTRDAPADRLCALGRCAARTRR